MANIPRFNHFTPDELTDSSIPEMRDIGLALLKGSDEHPFNTDATATNGEITTAEAETWRSPTAVEAAALGAVRFRHMVLPRQDS